MISLIFDTFGSKQKWVMWRSSRACSPPTTERDERIGLAISSRANRPEYPEADVNKKRIPDTSQSRTPKDEVFMTSKERKPKSYSVQILQYSNEQVIQAIFVHANEEAKLQCRNML